MTLLDDMAKTVRLMHSTYTERRLCCPECGGGVELNDGTLVCVQQIAVSDWETGLHVQIGCGWVGKSLAEQLLSQSTKPAFQFLFLEPRRQLKLVPLIEVEPR